MDDLSNGDESYHHDIAVMHHLQSALKMALENVGPHLCLVVFDEVLGPELDKELEKRNLSLGTEPASEEEPTTH